jgi:hypothetical protein
MHILKKPQWRFRPALVPIRIAPLQSSTAGSTARLKNREGAALRFTGANWLAAAAFGIAVSACSVQLVAPYNPELAQRASAMQAEVTAWDLQMRSGAGTIADDPRNPKVLGTLNRWRGEAEAMLTLAIANDPGAVNCSAALKAVSSAIESRLPPELHIAPSAASGAGAPARSCEAALVASIGIGIDDIEKALKYCRTDWVDDAYFMDGPEPPSDCKTASTSQPGSARYGSKKLFCRIQAVLERGGGHLRRNAPRPSSVHLGNDAAGDRLYRKSKESSLLEVSNHPEQLPERQQGDERWPFSTS